MTEQVRVVDPDASERSPAAPRSNWVVFALGFVVGVGAAVVFTTPAGISTPTDTTIEAITPPITLSDGGDAPMPGVGELVGDFPDAMVALVETETRSITHLLWPVAGPPVERPLPVGLGTFRFDSSGRWLAGTNFVPEDERSTLYMGITTSFAPLVSGVTSFAWHDSQTGDLAYTRATDQEGSLWVVESDRRPSQVLGGLHPMTGVASWGEWGFALQDPSQGQVALFNPEGELRSVLPAVAHGSHPSGWIVAFDGELMLVSAGGGVSRTGNDLAGVGEIVNAEPSPDRSLIAVRGSRGLLVVDAGDGSVRRVVQLLPVYPDLAWSSDSRFVLLPHARGVLVVDTASEPVNTVLGNRSVTAVGVIPLSGG